MLRGGYRLAFLSGAIFAAAAALVGPCSFAPARRHTRTGMKPPANPQPLKPSSYSVGGLTTYRIVTGPSSDAMARWGTRGS